MSGVAAGANHSCVLRESGQVSCWGKNDAGQLGTGSFSDSGKPVDVVFIGSCTNSRISDLRAAADVLKDRKVAENVRAMVVPGSEKIKKQAEAEGLPEIFQAAGAEWREAGCSMCIAMNGDQLDPGQYCVSTSNRNFEGRQGKGGRTFLASPITAAASAVEGKVADARRYVS